MTSSRFLLVLRARWRLMVCTVLASMIAAVVLSLLLPKQYTAASSVVVDVKGDPVAGTTTPATTPANSMSTQVDILESARVAQQVVKILKLNDDPEFRRQWQRATNSRGDITAWIAVKLQRKLLVTPSHESNVINIAVTWPDPKFSALLANAFTQADIETNIELKVDPAKEYASWFDERSRGLRADLESKQKRLADFQRGNGIVATAEKLDLEGARLTELSTELVQIQAMRQDSQSRQRQANGTTDSLPEVMQSPLISTLKASLSQSEAKMQDIAATLGKNHPDYQTTQAEVESLRDRIAQESANIVASLGSTTQVNIRRESEIQAALEAQKLRVLNLRHQRDEATVLENDVQSAQRNLDAVAQRLAQSSLESQTQQTNIMPLTVATEPVFPSSPRMLRSVIVALFLGFIVSGLIASVLETVDARIRSVDEVLEILDAPILGTLPSMKTIIRKANNASLRELANT